MASTSGQLSSDSSSSSNLIKRWSHDVFLSFRGEDTRYNFTDHLYAHLLRRGIKTFRDDRLTRGEEIQHELLKAIENSRCSVVVFSKNYAESRWCLEELAKIMECRKEKGQIVLPVFYHVNPSDVRKQTGRFGEAFTNHEINWKNKVQRWREALTEAANISGWDIEDGYESKFIKEISDFCKRLNDKCLFVGENLVGMDSYLRELTSKLKIQSNDHNVRIVGIWGVGGIGKTTIAKAIYNQISSDFGCVSFLENVKAIHKTGGIHDLQKQLLRDITGEKHFISNISRGAKVIQDTLQSRKALIVFDDIDDDLELLEYIVGEHHWFGRGSRVLITTRDRNSLHKVDDLCKIEGLNLKDALKLFSLYSFQQNVPEENYKILSNAVIRYCQGLPLALKVLGSLLCGKRTSEWESELHKLKNIPNAKIQDVLKISYDELDHTQQAIFLDIACFFKEEDRDFVSKILDCCEMFAESGIGFLEAKCLITISHNKIYMHDLIQEMGWEVICQQHPKDPNKWSRLWNPDDIHHAFMSEQGMKNVETISLKLSRSKEMWFTKEVFANMKKVFAKMKKLRLFKVYYSDDTMRKKYKTSLPEGFEFPCELRYLHWEGLEALPSNFDPENLVAINLKCSNIKKFWKRNKHHENLKFVDVSDSQHLIKMPKLSSMPNLERLNIGGCTSFCKLHSSIGAFPDMKFLKELLLKKTRIKELPSSIQYLTSLEILDVSECQKIQELPDIFGNMRCLRKLCLSETRIKQFPSSIGYLESLESLDLSNCYNFENFPEMVKTKCLRELFLVGTAIKELPNSIGNLESLETINLRHCSKFEKFLEIQAGNMKCLKELVLEGTAIKQLPNNIGWLKALEELDVNGCSNIDKFPEIQGNMGKLSYLDLSGTAIKELPYSIAHLKGLVTLNLKNCKSLKSLPGSMCELKSLRKFCLGGCSNLELKGFWEIIEEMKHLRELSLSEIVAITEVPSSLLSERPCLKGLRMLQLSNCENLVTLPNNLRSLQFCLQHLDLTGCNLMEGAIPSDLWCLSSLVFLTLSENNIRSIPTGIIQLSQLMYLQMNHCPMLEKIPELPSNLKSIQVHDCPRLKTLSCHPTKDLLWYSLLNSFQIYVEKIRCKKVRYTGLFRTHVVPHSRGRFGIPKWVKDKSMGCEVTDGIYMNDIYNDDKGLDALGLYFFPQNFIPDEYRSKRWKYLKACITREKGIKSCGIHLIYAQAQDDNKKRSRNHDINPAEEAESHSYSHHKRSRHVF